MVVAAKRSTESQIDAYVEILIGVNAHSAMEPWKIIHSQDDGPYAVRRPSVG